MGGLGFDPAAEITVYGGQRDRGELVLVLSQDFLVARAVKVLGLDLLRLGRIEELYKSLGGGTALVTVDILVHHRHRRLSQDRARGINDLVLAGAFLQRQMRLILPG